MEPSVDLAPAVVVDGRYRLAEALASGSTSSVWRATDVGSGEDVALKILRDEGVDPALRARAEHEARVLEDVTHPNLVRVLASGVDNGRPYIAMELLDGEPLARVIARRGSLPVDEAVDLAADVADGLGTVHQRGVIHRDVKPGNIVCGGTTPTLVDFGIARAVDTTTLTRGLVVGTAAYLAPEQAQGLALTPAADVYSLGCVLYELLTGSPPFDGDSPVTVALKHVQDEPVPPADLADLPAAVNAVVMRCLAKDPALRPRDGSELAAALREARADDSDDTVSIAPVGNSTMVLPVIDTTAASAPASVLAEPAVLADERAEPATPRRPRVASSVFLAVGAVLLVLLGIARIAGGGDAATRPVPDVTNAPVADAMTYLENAGLTADVVNVDSDAPRGTVVGSEPAAGEPVAVGGTVKLAVSTGSGPSTAPAPPPPADDAEGEADDDDGGGGRAKGKDKKDD